MTVMLRPIMSREDWQNAKRQGRTSYVSWRVAPFALAMLVVAIRAAQDGGENWAVVAVAPLAVFLTMTHWSGVYDRTRANYEDAKAS